jgi:hypothetical protein
MTTVLAVLVVVLVAVVVLLKEKQATRWVLRRQAIPLYLNASAAGAR